MHYPVTNLFSKDGFFKLGELKNELGDIFEEFLFKAIDLHKESQKLPDSFKPNASGKRSLPPDEFDLKTASTKCLTPCPFCGKYPMTMNTVNDKTGIYGCNVQCSDYRCNGSVFWNSHNKEESRQKAIEIWNKRVSYKASTHKIDEVMGETLIGHTKAPGEIGMPSDEIVLEFSNGKEISIYFHDEHGIIVEGD